MSYVVDHHNMNNIAQKVNFETQEISINKLTVSKLNVRKTGASEKLGELKGM